MNRWQAFLYGASRTFSLFPPPRSTYRIRDRDDAIAGDWRAIGDDLRTAMGLFRARNPPPTPPGKPLREDDDA